MINISENLNENVNTNIGVFLKSKGIKPSYQRIKIYEFLTKEFSHPTVDIIYQALVDNIPTLSKTTVYNTLDIFRESGIVNIVIIEENEARYDAKIEPHGHFKCSQCGKIYDFDLIDLKTTALDNFKCTEQHIYFKGICKECNCS